MIDLAILIIGVILSIFYGLSSYRVFSYPHKDVVYDDPKLNLKKLDVTRRARFHEGWTHFVCSVVGWICIYSLYKNLIPTNSYAITIEKLEFKHIVLFTIGLLGIVGFLPRTLWNLTEVTKNIADLTKKLIK